MTAHEMTGGQDAADRRCFFAVWPDASVRDHLAGWSQSIETDRTARAIPAGNLHITLVFLGALDAAQLEAVRRVGAAATWRGASLVLDRIGYWKRPRIVWAGSRQGSESLAALTEDLRGRLRRLGFRVEERPFVPHVTLFRKARRRPRWRERTITWQIGEFCLAESALSPGGAQYRVLDRWSATDDVE